MDIQQFIRDLLEGGEETAEEASRRRQGRLEEPLPYPGKLMKGMMVDPLVAAGKMAGGEVPYYLEEDLARTVYPGWMGGEPELEVFPRGTLNPAMPEGAADVAMNAPVSGLARGALKGGVVDQNLLGVNAPSMPKAEYDKLVSAIQAEHVQGVNTYMPLSAEEAKGYVDYVVANPGDFQADLTKYGVDINLVSQYDPQADQYEQMIGEINKAFDDMYGPNDPLYAPLEPTPNPPPVPAPAWTEPNYSDPGDIIYHQGVQAPAAAPQQMKAPPLPMAKADADKQKLAQYLASDAFISPSGVTGKEVAADPQLVDTYVELMLASPGNWSPELTAAGVGHLVPAPAKPVAAPAISNYAGEQYSGSGMEYNKLIDWIEGNYGTLPESEVEKMVDTIVKNPLHWGDQLKASGIDINQVADWVSLIPPAPVPNKFPWLPAAEPSTGGIITPYSGDFSAIREELYRRGLSQDPIMEMQRLTAGNTREGWREAADISDRLKGVLRGKPQDPYSLAVPHALDISRYNDSDKWDAYTQEMWDNALKYNKEAIESPFGQEFNWNLPLYRGTRSPTDQFMDPGTKYGERGLFHADRPGPAGNYGRYMYPLVSRAQNPVEIDFAGRRYGESAPGPWSSGDVDRHIEEARKAGHDLLTFRNLRDDDPSAPSGRSTQNQYVVFDPAILRSPFAAFDPARRGESNLLAGYAGGINPFAGQQQEPAPVLPNPFPWLPTNQSARARQPF